MREFLRKGKIVDDVGVGELRTGDESEDRIPPNNRVAYVGGIFVDKSPQKCS
jgi:hypothetical protein